MRKKLLAGVCSLMCVLAAVFGVACNKTSGAVEVTITARDVEIAAETPVDVSSLFTVTADGKTVTLTADMLDFGGLDTANPAEGRYRVTLTYVAADRKEYTKAITVTVLPKSDPGEEPDPGENPGEEETDYGALLAEAFSKDYSNRILNVYVNEDGEIYREEHWLTATAAAFYDNSESVVLPSVLFALEDGEVIRWFRSEQDGEWMNSNESLCGVYWTDTLIRDGWEGLSASDFYYDGAEKEYVCKADAVSRYTRLVTADDERYPVSALSLSVQNGLIRQIKATGAGLTIVVDVLEVGTTTVNVPDPEDRISLSVVDYPTLLSVGSAVDFTAYFRLEVNGEPVAVTPAMLSGDPSLPDGTQAGEFVVVCTFAGYKASASESVTVKFVEKTMDEDSRSALTAAFSADYGSFTASRVYSDDPLIPAGTFVTADGNVCYSLAQEYETYENDVLVVKTYILEQYYVGHGTYYNKYSSGVYLQGTAPSYTLTRADDLKSILYPDLSLITATDVGEFICDEGTYYLLDLNVCKALCIALGVSESYNDYTFWLELDGGKISEIGLSNGTDKYAVYTLSAIGASTIDYPEAVRKGENWGESEPTEPADPVLAAAFEKDYSNVTLTLGSSTYQWKDNVVYYGGSTKNYCVFHEDGSITRFEPDTAGGYTKTTENAQVQMPKLLSFFRLDPALFQAVEGQEGTYRAANASAIAEEIAAFLGFANMSVDTTKDYSITVTVADGYITSISYNFYYIQSGASYPRTAAFTVSAVGTTEFTVPENVAQSALS